MTRRPGGGRLRRRLAAAWHDEHGLATSVAVVLLAPLTTVLALIMYPAFAGLLDGLNP